MMMSNVLPHIARPVTTSEHTSNTRSGGLIDHDQDEGTVLPSAILLQIRYLARSKHLYWPITASPFIPVANDKPFPWTLL